MQCKVTQYSDGLSAPFPAYDMLRSLKLEHSNFLIVFCMICCNKKCASSSMKWGRIVWGSFGVYSVILVIYYPVLWGRELVC